MRHQRRSPVAVLILAVGGGVLAGLLMVLYEVVYNDYRGGIIPFWVGAVLLVVVAAGVALLSIGSAFAVFAAFTRFLSSSPLIVSVCATVAAVIGGGAGIVFGSGSESWIYPVLWTLLPALYVAIAFPRLDISWRKARRR